MSSHSLSDSQTASTGVDADSPADSLNSLLNEGQMARTSLVNVCAPDECAGEGRKNKGRWCCSTISQCTWGVLLLLLSVGGFLFTPLDFMLWEKMNMRPGFPPYEWWADPPDEVKLRVHLFNVTNHDRFLKGLDRKINLQEIGPIVYLEKLQHFNITFNENSTMTYTARRTPIFLPLENHIDMNATLIVPNLAVLGIASYLSEAPFFIRSGFRFLVSSSGSQFFVKKTVYQYLWEYKDPVLEMSRSLAPALVPVDNMGILTRIYSDFTDEMTVCVGPTRGHRNFFTISRFQGVQQLPGYDPDYCPDRITGSTEGVMYHQRISKEDVLLYWRKTVCKLMPLYYDRELEVHGVPVYRFNLSESVFDRVTNGTDCYDTAPGLPNGLSDGSKCYFDFPMVISYPHFYTGQPARDTYVTGLKPDREKHNSYVVVEPLTGTPFYSVARMQSNLRIRDLSGISAEYDRFSHVVLPMFWAEYSQEGLPTKIQLMIYFTTVILPPLSIFGLTCMILLGTYFLAKQIYEHKLKSDSLSAALPFKTKKVNELAKNTIFAYEKDSFLKKPD